MKTIVDKHELRELLGDWRREGEHVAIVPTMGNLHAGHISLVDVARDNAERVVVTVFVNPTQFGEGEDFDSYPRTIEKDTRRLKKASADVLFIPDVETVYPLGLENATRVIVPGLTQQLCGSFRPGHFDGVTTVVARLFALVQPDVAVFGEKDYQQQLVIRRMVEDLSLPISILSAPTVREEDGLAMSSRNSYLDAAERQKAPALFESLQAIAAQLAAGAREFADLEESGREALEQAGFEPEYVAIRSADDLGPAAADCPRYVVLAAAHLGGTRLIDNLVVDA
ncbi:MAG: pantoate--beta-alanine ligase [Woeseiaceae bacterium]|nr:pantoate--beta-alanine ligase [Woeseiaceae bacterium]